MDKKKNERIKVKNKIIKIIERQRKKLRDQEDTEEKSRRRGVVENKRKIKM